MSIFITCDAMQKVLCPKVLVRKKKLPYANFFLKPNFFGLNTFYMALNIIYMDQFMYLIIKPQIKNNFYCLLDNYYRQLPWNIGIFSAHSKSEKKVPYGSFFLRTKTFGHITFCIALHVMKMDNLDFLNYKISNKNNWLSLMDKYYRQ